MKGVALTSGTVETLDSLRKGESLKQSLYEGGTSLVVAGIGSKVGGIGEGILDKKFNPKWKEYTFETHYIPIPIQKSPERNYVPSVVGNTLDNAVSQSIKPIIDTFNKKGEESEKK